MGGLFARAGIGAASGGALHSALGELRRLNPRIVTDMKLTEGKAVTTFETDVAPDQLAGSAAKDAKKDVKKALKDPKNQNEAKQAAGEVREAVAGASWVAFAALFLAALASTFGGIAARRHVAGDGWER